MMQVMWNVSLNKPEIQLNTKYAMHVAIYWLITSYTILQYAQFTAQNANGTFKHLTHVFFLGEMHQIPSWFLMFLEYEI